MGYDKFSKNTKKRHSILIKNQKRKYPNREYLFSYNYFENHNCCFYPCHPDSIYGHNCMFCRCPLYHDDDCIGIKNGDGVMLDNGIKDCSQCVYPHEYKNAEYLSNYMENDNEL